MQFNTMLYPVLGWKRSENLNKISKFAKDAVTMGVVY